ncbi:choline transporter-like protein 4 isoform X2 [Amphibalanus amphitrite]|uniref:choline transporter-like protein 4 isoform X2 n=1 Tax=Amphibalanus amphitrite TaxID=1232801 RepID=UPI001C91D9AF|nr:choline transporter-like protein 4 isoform X2 [Amphibalanus amphitrite]
MGAASSKKATAEQGAVVGSPEKSTDYGSIRESPGPDKADGETAEPQQEAVSESILETDKAAGVEPPKQEGEPHAYDPDFNGPIKQRSCTDILCAILFIAVLIAWGGITIFALLYGDPQRLLSPTDTAGKKCGFDPGVEEKPYLHFFDISKCANPIVFLAGCPTHQVCVNECPSTNFFATPFGAKEELCVEEVRRRFYCVPGVNATERSTAGSFTRTCQSLLQRDCAPYTVSSAPIMGRCVPTLGFHQAVNGTLVDSNNKTMGDLTLDKILDACKNLGAVLKLKGYSEEIGKDFQSSWWVIVTALIVCMCVSLLWILLMRWITPVMVWVSLFGSLAAIIYGCVYTYLRYDYLRQEQSAPPSAGDERALTVRAFTANAGSLLADKDTWLAFFIVLVVLGVILLLLIAILFKRLRIAIEVIEEASKAVTSILTTLLYPLVPWLMQLAAIVFYATLTLYVASMGTSEYRVTALPDDCPESCGRFQMNATCDPDMFQQICQRQCADAECSFFGYKKFDCIPYIHFYNLFCLLWVLFFASAMGEMILAGAFAAWYWTFDKSKNLPTTPLLDSAGRTLRYHIGTLAFGSLIIAIVRLIRLILDYIQKKAQKYPGSEVVKAILCCCKCCMWCLEKFLKFINRNAYIMCAIYGKNFCTSAKDGFNLLMRNILRVLAVNSVCDFLLFLGKVLITLGVTVGSFYFLDSRIPIAGLETVVPSTNRPWPPTFTIAIGCYFITSLFFSVYEMAVDTIFLCFLEDIERNDGSADKPYFMSKDLMKLIGKKNKVPSKTS